MRLLSLILWIEFWRSGVASSMESTGNGGLGRSKREFAEKYLVFPEGSNVQLVYCMTISTYAKPAGLFTIGLTAGQAWELPSKSKLSGKLGDYHRRSRRQLYRKMELLLGSYEVRNIRRDDYRRARTCPTKIIRHDRKFQAMNAFLNFKENWNFIFSNSLRGRDGRACVLKAICNAARRNRREIGSRPFFQEILHAVFELPASYDDADPMTDYERAYYLKENCNEAQYGCPDMF